MSADRHIVICGWNDNGQRLVADLLRSDQTPTVRVVSPTAVRPSNTRIQRVEFILADPSTADGLRAVEVDKADVVVILGDLRDGRSKQDADARAILTGLSIERLRPQVHTIAELFSADNIFHAKNAGVNEVIISGAHTGAMLSQAVQSPGVLAVFGDLFLSGKGSRLREAPLPEALEGATFLQAYRTLLIEQQGVLVGLRRAGRMQTGVGPGFTVAAGDRVIILQRLPTP
jgi:voltage-gated potassium channel